MKPKLTYTVNETCDLLGISRGTFYELMHSGQIVTLKIGKRRLVAYEDILAFLDEAKERIA